MPASTYAISGLTTSDVTYNPAPRRIYVHDNDYSNNAYEPQGLVADVAGPSVDPAFFDCAHASLAEVVLDTPEVIAEGERPPTEAEIAELCTPAGGEVNFGAVEVSCHEQAAYSTRDVFDFPVGTIIAKTFAMPNDFLNPGAGEIIIETRLLIHRRQGWATLPYVWREDGSGADLSVTRAETGSGVNLETVNLPIGPKARFLNRDNSYAGETRNQLTHMAELGALAGLPADLDTIDTAPDWEDLAQPLQERAKAYMDINCGHCHSPGGGLWRAAV